MYEHRLAPFVRPELSEHRLLPNPLKYIYGTNDLLSVFVILEND